ncbi:acetylcholinesterase-like [Diadema antillarum]|uniref:acetylcholinesterase-like n=1 Tax=Diadema antillarum TaxID=105358 RepID=UPI003A88CE83
MASRLALFLLALTSCSLPFVTSTDGDDVGQPVVKTSRATFLGERHVVESKQLPGFRKTVAAYTGIPYAEPPVGDLRFARPVGKNVEGEFDATRPPVACSQAENQFLPITLEMTEDCLHLHVFVPEPKPESQAVLFWIHGGGYHIGAPLEKLAHALPLPALGDVIVVAINYRLGVLGFLATENDEIPANLGLLDQRQALLWVQENIAAFGGDPNRVTIFGESAGSGSVALQILSPMSAGLFSGAIMQSGALALWSNFPDKATGVYLTTQIAAKVGCDVTSSKAMAECLRSKPFEELKAVQENTTFEIARYMVLPVPDGEFLPKSAAELAAEGAFNKVNIISGCLSEEGDVMANGVMFGQDPDVKPSVNETVFKVMLATMYQMTEPVVQDMAKFVYCNDEMLSNPEANFIDPLCDLAGDNFFLCPAFSYARQLSAAGLNVYSYVMTHRPSHSIWGRDKTWMGATHGEDIAYVFGSPFGVDSEDKEADYFLIGRFTEEEVEISQQIIKYWSNFAKTGDPNSGSDDEKYPTWPKYRADAPVYKELARSFETHTGTMFGKRCYFLEKVLPSLTQNSAEMARLKALLEEKVNADSSKTCEDPDNCPEN